MRKYTLAFFAIAFSIGVQAQLKITGEIRPRAEFRDGFKTLKQDGLEPAFFVEQRSRLGIDFKKDKILLKLSFQDIRFWGGASQIYKTDNALFNMNEAWAGYKISDYSTIKVGRMHLDYDNARILGNLAWAQQSRSHDLVKFEYASEGGFNLHIGAAFNQETVNANAEPARLFSTFYSGVNNYKSMQYAWGNTKYDAGSFSFLALSTGYQVADSSQNFLFTVGPYWKHDFGGLKVEMEGYYQLGKDASDTDVSAYMGSIALGTKLGETALWAGVDYLSGNDPDATENNSFSPLFGTNHKFYGFMDYFYVGNPAGNVGLTDLYLKLNFKLTDKSNLLAHGHYFMSQATILEGSEEADSYLGTELDLVFNSNVDKGVNLKIGFSAMDPGDSMGLIKSGDPSKMTFWGWTMLTIKPVLFESKKSLSLDR